MAAFRATLEEISEADLLIHVVDATHSNALAQWDAVNATLAEIDAHQIPVITVLNIVDRLSPDQRVIPEDLADALPVSALKGEGLPELISTIESNLFETFIPITVHLPYQQGRLISLFHDQGQVERVEHGRGGVTIKGQIPGRLLVSFQGFVPRFKAEKAGEESEGE